MLPKKAQVKDYGLSEIEQELFDMWQQELPPVIAREKIGDFLGGLVKPSSMNVFACSGNAPEEAYRIGRKIAYKRDSLLLWLLKTYKVQKVMTSKDL